MTGGVGGYRFFYIINEKKKNGDLLLYLHVIRATIINIFYIGISTCVGKYERRVYNMDEEDNRKLAAN